MADLPSLLKREAGRIGTDGIYRRTLHTSPWNDLVVKKTWPDGMGKQISQLSYARALPKYDHSSASGTTYDTVGVKWQDIHPDSSDPQYSQATLDINSYTAMLKFRTEVQTYNLQRTTVKTQMFDIEDLRVAFNLGEQLGEIIQILAENVNQIWEDRNRDEYLRLCKYAIVLDGASNYTDLNPATTASPDPFEGLAEALAPVDRLFQDNLDRIWTQLNLSGARNGAYGIEDGAPVFTAVLSSEASDKIRTAAEVRTDFRESPRVSELLAPLGVRRSYRGWYHLIDDKAPRYKVSSGVLTRVPVYVEDGNGAFQVNADYFTAPYEVAFVFHKDVMQSYVPKPLGAQRSLKFDPVKYAGDFEFLNYRSDSNPRGTTGYFHGLCAAGYKAMRDEFGYAILFDRSGDMFGGYNSASTTWGSSGSTGL